jgi:hypothetical protein
MTRKQNPASVAVRLDALDVEIDQVARELDAAERKAAGTFNPSDADLDAVTSLASMLGELTRQRDTLRRVVAKKIELGTDEASAQKAARVAELHRRIDALTTERGERAFEVQKTFDTLGGPIAAMVRVEEELQHAVLSLWREFGRSLNNPPDTAAHSAGRVLLRDLASSGVAASGYAPFRNQVVIKYSEFSAKPPTLAEALTSDTSRLLTLIQRTVEGVTEQPSQSWIELHHAIEQGREAHAAAEQEAGAARLREDTAKRKARAEQRARDSNLSVEQARELRLQREQQNANSELAS